MVMGNLPSLSSTEMSLATRLQHLQHLFRQEPPPATPSTPVKAPPPPAQAPPQEPQVRFNKKLLDFDYDEEDEEVQQQPPPQEPPLPQAPAPPPAAVAPPSAASETLGSLLTNPDILRHLQSLQQQIGQPGNHHPSIQHPAEEAWPPPELMPYHPTADFSQPPPGFMASMAQHPPPFGLHLPAQPAMPVEAPPPQRATLREDLFQPAGQEGGNNGHHPMNVELDPPRSK